MKNRFLFVGDGYLGPEGRAWQLLTELLLCEFPEQPLQFHLNTQSRHTLDFLLTHCSRDIIGKQAGTILLCVGFQDLQNQISIETIGLQYAKLIHEIQSNSLAQIFGMTLYAPSLPQSVVLNQLIDQQLLPHQIIDFHSLCLQYQKHQAARGEHQRNLLDTQGRLAPLGEMLLARATASHLFPQYPQYSL